MSGPSRKRRVAPLVPPMATTDVKQIEISEISSWTPRGDYFPDMFATIDFPTSVKANHAREVEASRSPEPAVQTSVEQKHVSTKRMVSEPKQGKKPSARPKASLPLGPKAGSKILEQLQAQKDRAERNEQTRLAVEQVRSTVEKILRVAASPTKLEPQLVAGSELRFDPPKEELPRPPRVPHVAGVPSSQFSPELAKGVSKVVPQEPKAEAGDRTQKPDKPDKPERPEHRTPKTLASMELEYGKDRDRLQALYARIHRADARSKAKFVAIDNAELASMTITPDKSSDGADVLVDDHIAPSGRHSIADIRPRDKARSVMREKSVSVSPSQMQRKKQASVSDSMSPYSRSAQDLAQSREGVALRRALKTAFNHVQTTILRNGVALSQDVYSALTPIGLDVGPEIVHDIVELMCGTKGQGLNPAHKFRHFSAALLGWLPKARIEKLLERQAELLKEAKHEARKRDAHSVSKKLARHGLPGAAPYARRTEPPPPCSTRATPRNSPRPPSPAHRKAQGPSPTPISPDLFSPPPPPQSNGPPVRKARAETLPSSLARSSLATSLDAQPSPWGDSDDEAPAYGSKLPKRTKVAKYITPEEDAARKHALRQLAIRRRRACALMLQEDGVAFTARRNMAVSEFNQHASARASNSTAALYTSVQSSRRMLSAYHKERAAREEVRIAELVKDLAGETEGKDVFGSKRGSHRHTHAGSQLSEDVPARSNSIATRLAMDTARVAGQQQVNLVKQLGMQEKRHQLETVRHKRVLEDFDRP